MGNWQGKSLKLKTMGSEEKILGIIKCSFARYFLFMFMYEPWLSFVVIKYLLLSYHIHYFVVVHGEVVLIILPFLRSLY